MHIFGFLRSTFEDWGSKNIAKYEIRFWHLLDSMIHRDYDQRVYCIVLDEIGDKRRASLPRSFFFLSSSQGGYIFFLFIIYPSWHLDVSAYLSSWSSQPRARSEAIHQLVQVKHPELCRPRMPLATSTRMSHVLVSYWPPWTAKEGDAASCFVGS